MAAALIGTPGIIGICQGGESAILRLRARDDGFGNPCVPHSSIRLLVRFLFISKAGLAVNISRLAINRCQQYYPPPNSHRE